MYKVARSDKRVSGTVTSRLKNTMVVSTDDGYTYLCELVGEPDKLPDFSLEGVKRNFDNAGLRKKVKVVESDGTTKVFESIGDVANTYRIARQTVALGCKTGKVTKNGKATGFLFSWA